MDDPYLLPHTEQSTHESVVPYLPLSLCLVNMPCSIKYLVHDASGTYTAVQILTFLPVKYMISEELLKEFFWQKLLLLPH